MEYHTMTTKTRANMARNFQPAGYIHRGAGGRNRQMQSQCTSSPAPPEHCQPPGPLLATLAQGWDPSASAALQDEEGLPGSGLDPPPPPGVPGHCQGTFMEAILHWGSPWTTLTGLADHVSQQVAGILGRTVIPAASGHLGGRIPGVCLVGSTYTPG